MCLYILKKAYEIQRNYPGLMSLLRDESHCIQTALTELFLFTDKQHLCVQITEISFTVRKVTFN